MRNQQKDQRITNNDSPPRKTHLMSNELNDAKKIPMISPSNGKERMFSPFSADSVIKARTATLSPTEIPLRPKIISRFPGESMKYTTKDIPKLDIGLVLRKRNKVVHQRKRIFKTMYGNQL